MVEILGASIEAAAKRGQLDEFLRGERVAIYAGTKKAVGEATDITKRQLRGTINSAFTGSRLTKGGNRRVANAIRSKTYDDSAEGRGFTGFVYSRFGRGRGEEWVDYLLPHIRGAVITPRRRRWLMIVTPAGDTALGNRRTRRSVRNALDKLQEGDSRIKWIPAKGRKKIYLVRQQKNKTELLAVLVKRVSLRKRLDLAPTIRASGETLQRRLVLNLEREGGQ